MMDELNVRVQQVIDRLITSGEEVGLQVAAYVDGALVVDAWAGVADEATGRPVYGETLFTSWSTTKGFTATCLHILADRGGVEYDMPVAHYWPEFAAHGKAAVTVRHALIHTAGIPQMPERVTPDMLADWDGMCAAIADLTPLWAPGTTVAYHAWTFGWILGEVLRRVDGRSLSQFAREELCQPLGIADFYLGIPDSVEPRVATLRQEPPPVEAVSPPSDLSQRVMPPNVTNPEVINRPNIRSASLPASGGIMSARAVARHYAMLAEHGVLEGTRVLSSERVAMISSLQTDAHDEVLGAPRRKGLGYVPGGNVDKGGDYLLGAANNAFGHGGLGGSIGFADPSRHLSVGLTKTLMKSEPDPYKAVAYLVADTIRTYLDDSRT